MKAITNPDHGRRRSRRDVRLWPDDIDQMREDIEQWMTGRLRGFPGLREGGDPFWAEMDMIESNGEIELTFDVPGFRKEDIEIEVESDRVVVHGRRQAEEKTQGRNHLRVERHRGEFSRSVALPVDVDPGKASAELKDGVLRISLTKIEKAEPARRIAIK